MGVVVWVLLCRCCCVGVAVYVLLLNIAPMWCFLESGAKHDEQRTSGRDSRGWGQLGVRSWDAMGTDVMVEQCVEGGHCKKR